MTRPAYVRQLAAELEILSHGACASWNPAGGAGIPDSRAPFGDANPPHAQFLAEWDRRGDVVLDHWLGELKRWKGCGRVRPAGKSESDLILEDGRGHSPEDVARRFRCTPTRVRRLRRDAGVNEETGTGESVVARAKRMRENGVPVREIASAVGKHPTQVQRWTGKTAA